MRKDQRSSVVKPSFSELNAFVAVANQRSFKRAADELGLATSSLSHSLKSLEAGLGVRLLNRTTRSVSLTEAGHSFLAQLTPVLHDLDTALERVIAARDAPSGTVRISAPEMACWLLLRDVVPHVLDRYPDVSVDLVADGRFIDIVESGFDAGVRLGESLAQDMVAVRFGGEVRFLAIASPRYLEREGSPKTPDDLKRHHCIRHRMPSGKLYRHWEFERRGQRHAVDVSGRLTLNSIPLMVEAALNAAGIAFVPESACQPHLLSGSLVPVLSDWNPHLPGLFLYYPGHRQLPAALKAFIAVLKEKMPYSPREVAGP